MKKTIIMLTALAMMTACGGSKGTNTKMESEKVVTTAFDADSCYAFCAKQCDFGPRTMNSEAHELCGQWIVEKFRSYGMEVTEQRATLMGFDDTPLQGNNIIAHYQPQLSNRILLCAHWDSRPWADNDPDPANHTKPVMAANDGASGVAVMLEVARVLCADTCRLPIGIDFVCFDAEDWGTPQWAEDTNSDGDTWALGAQYWAEHLKPQTSDIILPEYGILLDMVGGQGAKFYQEQVSTYFAPEVVKKVWAAADAVGFGSYFPKEEGGAITDDHLPVNQKANIPCIDIIPYYPDCEASSFGPTWHTVNDDMQHIDRNTLQAVGQTIIQVLYQEH